MDDHTKLDLEAALKVIEDLLREQLRTSGRLPETIVTVGGTALAALRIRERSDDVDLYMSEIDDTAIDTVTKKYRAQYGFNFKIDATPGNTIWGSLAIDDIDQSPTVATIEIGDVAVRIRALTPETLYLIKVAADRPKDRIDVPLIASKCSYESLLPRALQLFPWYGDRSAFTECHVEAEGSDLHDAGGQKIIFIATKETQIDERTFAIAVRQAFELGTTAVRGVRQVCLNWTTSTSVRQKLLHEVAPPSVLVELWVENVDIARLEDVGRDLMAVAVKQSAYEIDPHIVLEWMWH
jgi:hypothetical protein